MIDRLRSKHIPISHSCIHIRAVHYLLLRSCSHSSLPIRFILNNFSFVDHILLSDLYWLWNGKVAKEEGMLKGFRCWESLIVAYHSKATKIKL